jgi:hypothetical protein
MRSKAKIKQNAQLDQPRPDRLMIHPTDRPLVTVCLETDDEATVTDARSLPGE